MSRLRHNRLLIGLVPGQLQWVRLSGLFKPEVTAHGHETLPPGQTDTGALLDLLAKRVLTDEFRNARVTLTLSGGLVRYLVVPKRPGLKGRDERSVLAAHRYAQIYGEASRRWQVTVSQSGGECVACAVDLQLINGIREIFSRESIAVSACQPSLMALFNRQRRHLPRQFSGWLALFEQGFVTYARIDAGQWADICIRRGSSLAELARWLERDNVSGMAAAPCNDVWVAGIDLAAANDLPFSFHLLNRAMPAGIGLDCCETALFGVA